MSERAYDAFGNVTLSKDHGRTDVAGDELMVSAPVAANKSAYIVDRPSSIATWDVFDTAQPRIGYRRFAYDLGTLGGAPTKGDVVRQTDYQSESPAIVFTDLFFTYDTFGNQTSVTDSNGNRTETLYDTVFDLFPVAVRDPLYPTDNRHLSTADYDTVCGAPSAACAVHRTGDLHVQ